jgi:hypothetical protein
MPAGGVEVLLLTLATPHRRPPLVTQPSMLYWSQRTSAESLPPQVKLVVSIHGGGADAQVSEQLSMPWGEHAHPHPP